MKSQKDSAERGAGSGCMARLVRFDFFGSRDFEISRI